MGQYIIKPIYNENKDKYEYAIFYIDDNGNEKQISKEWYFIYPDGLVDYSESKSEYYIVQRDDDKKAIFHKDDPEHPISKWWNDIYTFGLVNGESDYYIVLRNIGGYFIFLIFHKDNKNFPVFISDSGEEIQNVLNKIKDLSPLEAFFKYNNLC